MDRIEATEAHLAHLTKAVDELNDVVTRQAEDIARLKKQVAALIDRARDTDGGGGIVFGDERPPHY